MTPIHPINEHQCKPHYGKSVCVILMDGTEIFGTLSRLDGNSLILNEEPPLGSSITKSAKGSSRTRRGRARLKLQTAKQAKTTAFPVSPFGTAIVLDLAIIALLFALV